MCSPDRDHHAAIRTVAVALGVTVQDTEHGGLVLGRMTAMQMATIAHAPAVLCGRRSPTGRGERDLLTRAWAKGVHGAALDRARGEARRILAAGA